jgi:hypothetical protein
MAPDIFITIAFMLAFVVFGNYGIHLYFKNKRKLLVNRIGGQKFVEVKNIRTEIYAKSKLSISWELFRSDIILFENSLLILLSKQGLNGLINQNQSIIQINKNERAEKLDGVERVYVLQNIEYIGTKIKLSYTQHLILKGKCEIKLDFKDTPDELKTVAEFIDSQLK